MMLLVREYLSKVVRPDYIKLLSIISSSIGSTSKTSEICNCSSGATSSFFSCSGSNCDSNSSCSRSGIRISESECIFLETM